jgi:outer membrane protein assembly factor BamB
MALDRHTGKTIWETTAYRGVPREKRHIKATYANSTPATDGRHVVAFFGSQGLYAFDTRGRQLWKKDLGVLNAGAYDLPEYEWGNASSPIMFRNLVIVQCDTQTDSFVLAADLATGKTVWRTARQELPSWGTPAVFDLPGGPQLVTNASNFIRGYDPLTGTELWRLGGSSKITAPTPILSSNLIVVASGRAPERPIFAIRPDARGDITLADGETSNRFVAWRKTGRGPYMPTPIAYRDRLYVLANQGLLDAYDAATGNEIYRQRIPGATSGFSASPVAADGRLYLSSEDGEIIVVRAGAEFAIASRHPMGEPLMATPAIAGGLLYVRGEKRLFAIGSGR